MSASLLNTATLPGSGVQAGASVGIGAQAAQAAQNHGPMAGFEALLAAFFGDQGLTVPTIAGQAVAGQAIAGQPGAAPTPAGKTTGKTASGDKAAASDADKAAAATTATATDAAAAAVDAALALALAAPTSSGAQPAQTAKVAADPNATGQAPDAGLSGKPAAGAAQAQLTAATAATDAKTAKDAGVVAQDTTKASTTATATATATAAAAAPQAAKPVLPPAPQGAAQPLQAPALSNQTPVTTAAALPAPTPVATPVAAAQAKAADAVGGKDKALPAKTVRIDGARSEAPPAAVVGKTSFALQAAADSAGKDASSQEHDPATPSAAEAKPAAGDNAQTVNDFNLATNAATNTNAAALAHAAALVRGSPQTVANLAAQIAKKLDGRSSRFDVQLDPAGLGKVDVRVEIDSAGKMTAAMNFDNQQAANELKSRAGELQRALEQAGFDMSGGMSFDVASQGGQNGGAQGQNPDNANASRGRAFQAVLDGAAEADASQISYSRAPRAGVDIRI